MLATKSIAANTCNSRITELTMTNAYRSILPVIGRSNFTRKTRVQRERDDNSLSFGDGLLAICRHLSTASRLTFEVLLHHGGGSNFFCFYSSPPPVSWPRWGAAL